MIKKIIYILLTLTIIVNCKAKYITNRSINDKFEKFDINSFKYNKIEVLDKGLKKTTSSISPKRYFVYFYPKNEYYSLIKIYDSQGFLIKKGLCFGDVEIGKWISYDKGKITNKIDCDSIRNTKFSYNDIIKYIHNRGKINKFKKSPLHKISVSFTPERYWKVAVYYNKTEELNTPFKVNEYIFDEYGKVIKIKENIELTEW